MICFIPIVDSDLTPRFELAVEMCAGIGVDITGGEKISGWKNLGTELAEHQVPLARRRGKVTAVMIRRSPLSCHAYPRFTTS
jgi:hypothetical protein